MCDLRGQEGRREGKGTSRVRAWQKKHVDGLALEIVLKLGFECGSSPEAVGTPLRAGDPLRAVQALKKRPLNP